jgi:hypothetical protein
MSRRAFCEALGLCAERPIVCYAASLHDRDQSAQLDQLARRLPELAGSPQLLVRGNPMCADLRSLQAIEHQPGVAVLRPRWEWLPERDWNCPLPDDLPWWRATLEHCHAAITLPSTITLDFAAWAKPAVNVVWGPGAEMWKKDRYAAVRRAPGTLAASSFERILTLAEDVLREPPRLASDRSEPVDAAATLVHRALGERSPRPLSRRPPLEAAAP